MKTVSVQHLSFTEEILQPRDLEYIAYSGQHELAHGVFRSIDQELRSAYLNKYVFHSVILGGIGKLRKYLASSADEKANEEKAFLDSTLLEFFEQVRAERSFPRELLESALAWCEELTRLSLLTEALRYYDRVLGMEASRYPDLHARLICGKAEVLTTMGRFNEAESLLRSLVDRPYSLTSRNFIPKVMFSLAKVSAQRGDLSAYETLLFRGLRLFYTDTESRRALFEQIKKTYRRSYKVISDPKRTLPEKFLFAFHWFYFRAQRSRLARVLRIDRVIRLTLLCSLYYLAFVWRKGTETGKGNGVAQRLIRSLVTRRNGNTQTDNSRNILVTRAMGGIGDLLMMTPGLHELKNKNPGREIHLAIPRRYFPLFDGNDDVELVDIEHHRIDAQKYRTWFNFSECPAARIESRTAPRVRKNRVEIFARALGVSRHTIRLMDRKPRYFVSQQEEELQKEFWRKHRLEGKTVVGVQLHSEESYRNYPYMKDLIRALTKRYEVLVFDGDEILESFGPRAIPVSGLAMRKAFAIAAGCDAIVCPDSAFVHLAAAFDIPCVALYGPIDGSIRTKDYPKCIYLDARDQLGCLPCWRNEVIACKLTNMRTSVCMAAVMVPRVHQVLEQVLEGKDVS